jgi:hypothetical protein
VSRCARRLGLGSFQSAGESDLFADAGLLAVFQCAIKKVGSRRVQSHLRSSVPALTRSMTPAFKHTINVVANGVSGIDAANSLHKKAIVFRMPVADGRHHRRS